MLKRLLLILICSSFAFAFFNTPPLDQFYREKRHYYQTDQHLTRKFNFEDRYNEKDFSMLINWSPGESLRDSLFSTSYFMPGNPGNTKGSCSCKLEGRTVKVHLEDISHGDNWSFMRSTAGLLQLFLYIEDDHYRTELLNFPRQTTPRKWNYVELTLNRHAFVRGDTLYGTLTMPPVEADYGNRRFTGFRCIIK